MSDIPDLTWLIERRSRIQSFLLQLYMFAEKSRTNSVDLSSGLFQLLVGSAFSLWRAVFLIYPDRQESKAEKHAQEFLKLLIRDNAINYSQDLSSPPYTFFLLNGDFITIHFFSAK